MKELTIYTDGACKKNKLGSWAAIILYKETEKELMGRENNTTNNKMELQGPIEALKILKEPCNVTIYSDSMYVVNGGNTWMYNWQKNNWILSSSKSAVKNLEQWKSLYDLCNIHKVKFKWVKGHNGDKYNERCDSLCNEIIK